MSTMNIKAIWASAPILKKAFEENTLCLKDVYGRLSRILQTPEDVPQEFGVRMGDIPEEFYSVRKNIFSTLFQSMYQLLEVPLEFRILYGKLNYLFRIWVTSADNLLDLEDKVVIPLVLPGEARVMRQVVSIMAADRVLKELLDGAEESGMLSPEEAGLLSARSLQILLPSAAEEASEEGGVFDRPDPEYVLQTIHRLKTGLLFHIPFLGPSVIQQGVSATKLRHCKDALSQFALGCQILDDIRDIARDHVEKRNNYILSLIDHQEKTEYQERLRDFSRHDIEKNIFEQFPDVVEPAAVKAQALFLEGLDMLKDVGLNLSKGEMDLMARSMFYILGVKELLLCVKEN